MDGDNRPSDASDGADFFKNTYLDTLEAAPIEVATQNEPPVQTQDTDLEYSNFHFDEAWSSLGAQAGYQPIDAFDQFSDWLEEDALDYTLSNDLLPEDSLFDTPANASMAPMENNVVSPAQLVLSSEQAQQQQRLIEQQQAVEVHQLTEQMRQRQQQQRLIEQQQDVEVQQLTEQMRQRQRLIEQQQAVEVQQLTEQMRQRQQQQQQQQPQVNALPATPQSNESTAQPQLKASPALEKSPMQSQLANQQQQQPQVNALPATPQSNESTAQPQLKASPALGKSPMQSQLANQQQQQPQVNAFPATPPQFRGFPAFKQSPVQSQLANQHQQQLPATLAQLQPNESPAQRQLNVSPAQFHSTEQQQHQDQTPLNSEAFIESLSLIKIRIRPLLDMSCRLVEHVNKMRRFNHDAEVQFLARLQITPRTYAAVRLWRDDKLEHQKAKALHRVAEVPRNVTNIRFDDLLLMTLCVSHDFMDIMHNLQTEGFFERQDMSSAALRQVIVGCHTEALNTLSSILSVLRHDRSLLPFTYGLDGALVVMCPTHPPQIQEGQGQTCPGGVATVIIICTQIFYRQCSLVRLVVPELPQMGPLPPQQQVHPVAPELLKSTRFYQQQIQKVLPPQQRMWRLESGHSTFSHATNEQIVFMEAEVHRFLGFIRQILPRQFALVLG